MKAAPSSPQRGFREEERLESWGAMRAVRLPVWAWQLVGVRRKLGVGIYGLSLTWG